MEPNSAPAPSPRPPGPVLLYDHTCGLCQRGVRLLLRLDRLGRLHFAALQSPPAREFLRAHGLPTSDFDSLVLVVDWSAPAPGAYHLRTDGALAAFAALGRPWGWVAGLRLVPRPVRDAVYRVVARRRHAWFGPARPGRPERVEWAERFLDT